MTTRRKKQPKPIAREPDMQSEAERARPLPFLEWVAVDDLVPWDMNPKDHPEEQLAALEASIVGEGFTTVLRAHRESMRIVAGHGRRLALLRVLERNPEFSIRGAPGPRRVPVVFYDGTWDEAQASAIRDNVLPELGAWDDGKLAQVVKSIRADESTAELAGRLLLEDSRVRALLRIAAGGKNPRDVRSPPTPALPTVPDSEEGALYELGPHRLLCGDATNLDDVERLCGARHVVDCAFTDPPFAIYGSSSGIGSSIADDKMIRSFFREILVSLEAAARLYAGIYVCCDWRSWASWWNAAKGTHLQAKNKLVWDKGSSGLGSNWANTYEEIGYWINCAESKAMTSAEKRGSQIRPSFSPNVLRPRDGDEPWTADDGPAQFLAEEVEGFLRFPRVSGKERLHNAAKPVPLIMKVLDVGTEEGASVLDLFGGSGSTLIAAARTGRVCRMMELEPAWCDVIRRRFTTWADEAGVDAGPGALR